MRICYVLLSPTFGMHQYTSDLANRMTRMGHELHIVTTTQVPRDRYAPTVAIHTPVQSTNTGLSFEALQFGAVRRALQTIRKIDPDVVHFTGPHMWNTWLVLLLRILRVPVIHTIHDLHPHVGTGYGQLLCLWNVWIRLVSKRLLVHGECYRKKLGADGERVMYTPLTCLPVSWAQQQTLNRSSLTVEHQSWVLFFGRLEAYKGLDVLIEAARQIDRIAASSIQVVIAGQGQLAEYVQQSLPANIKLLDRFISDEEAIDLFGRCGIVVLPYIEATQSAQIATAYFFCKPVIVTRVGALHEYVVEGKTGWVVPPNDSQALANSLSLAFRDPDRLVQMGKAGRAWYEDQRKSEIGTLVAMYAELGKKNVHISEAILDTAPM